MAKAISAGFITDKINGIAVNTSLKCNTSNYNNADSRGVAYIVMHYTGNSKDVAKNNANYFTGANREASAHLFVDDTEIYQSVELRDIAWHCGTKGTYYHAECRNANSFGIEMCCTAGNYKISETTKKNAAYLCAYLCKMIGVSASQVDTYVLRHYDISHKKCPAQMVDSAAEWTAFKTMVKNVLNTGNVDGAKPAAKFKVGDLVKLSSDAVYYTGKAVPNWVKNLKWYVTSVSGDRVVLGKSEDGKNDINSPVSDQYLTAANKTVAVKPTTTTTTTATTTTTTTTTTTKPAATVNTALKKKIVAWQKAAMADGFKFPKYGPDGSWGAECESVAKQAICKKQLVYKNKNLTKFLQGQLGITADGKFGANTRNAVFAYQKKNKLTADGVVGLNTWKKILGV